MTVSRLPVDALSLFLELLFPAGLILAAFILAVLRKRFITKKSVTAAAVSLLLFGLIFVTAHAATYASPPDARLIKTYLAIAVIGAFPVMLPLYFLGFTFLAGSAVGWVIDCVIASNMNPLEPHMSAGMANLAAVIVGSLLAVILEVAYQGRQRYEGGQQ